MAFYSLLPPLYISFLTLRNKKKQNATNPKTQIKIPIYILKNKYKYIVRKCKPYRKIQNVK